MTAEAGSGALPVRSGPVLRRTTIDQLAGGDLAKAGPTGHLSRRRLERRSSTSTFGDLSAFLDECRADCGTVWSQRNATTRCGCSFEVGGQQHAPLSISYAVITIATRLRYDYDPTTTYRARLLPTRRKQKTNMSIFRHSRIVVVS